MKKIALLLAAVVMACVTTLAQQAPPQPPKDIATVFDRSLSNAEREFVSLVEAMPEDKFNFKPTQGEFKDVRTFSQQVRHVASGNYEFGSMFLGEKPPIANGPDENGPDFKTKAEIVKYLKDSFAYLHKATATLKTDNAVEQVGTGNFRPTRMGLAMLSVSHIFDHYGQLVEYARMNGVIPPASRQ